MSLRQCRRCYNFDDGGGSRFCCGSCGFPLHSHSHSYNQIGSSSSQPPSIASSSTSPFSGFLSSLEQPRGEGDAPAGTAVREGDNGEAAALAVPAGNFVEEPFIFCGICKKLFDSKKDAYYALEFCRHGFCRTCLTGHVAKLLQQPRLHLATIEDAFEGIPCPACALSMSRQDIRMAAGAKALALFDAFVVDLVARRFGGHQLENSCPNCASATEDATLVKPGNLPELTSMRIREALMARDLPFSGSKASCLQRLQAAVAAYPGSLSFCLSCDFIQCGNCGDMVKDHPKSASSTSPSAHECPPNIKLLRSLFCCLAKLEKVAPNKTEAKKAVATLTNASGKASVPSTSKRKLTAAVDWFEKAKADNMSIDSKLPKPGKNYTKSNQSVSHPHNKSINFSCNAISAPTWHHPFGHVGCSEPPKLSLFPSPAYNHSAVTPLLPSHDWWSPMNYSTTATYEADEEDMNYPQDLDEESIGFYEGGYNYYPHEENIAGNYSTPGSKGNSSTAPDYTTAPLQNWIPPLAPMMYQNLPKKAESRNEAMLSKARASAANSEKAADLEVKQIFEQLVEIVGLFPPNPEKLPPPVVALVCSHKVAMQVMGELVRNDSILDVSTRSMLYFELFSLLQAFSSRRELLPFLCHPWFSNSVDVWMQKNRWKSAGSLAGDLRKLYRQMKGLLGKSSYLTACTDDDGSMEAALVAVGTSTYKELKNAIQAWERTSRHTWCEDADDYFRRFGFGDSAVPNSLSTVFPDTRDVEVSLLGVRVSQSSNSPATKGGNLVKDGEFIYTPSSEEVEAYKNALQPLQHGFESLSESHYYRKKQNEGNWRVSSIRQVSKEIAVLSTNLPLEWESSIFIRFDNSRMDLIKVLIIGPQNTPYMNGVFLFDMWLSENYPDSPPLMQFLTTGGGLVRFNPNLYKNGKVCLSLLGTWDGPSWVGGQSTILQVLISIQSLVFVANPYSNEPGQEDFTVENCPSAREYMETQQWNTLMYSMLPALRNPDPIFKDVILTHFRLKREEINRQCARWVEASLRNVCVAEAVQKELLKLT